MAKQRQRVYTKHVQYTQDLFLSDVKDTWKDLGYKGNRHVTNFPHKHTYRSVDSKGRLKDRTPTKNGHFHFVEFDPESLEVTKVSQAMVLVPVKNEDGKVVRHDPQPLHYHNRQGEYVVDTHTHEFEYARSFDYDSIKAQQSKEEAKKEYKAQYGAQDVESMAKSATRKASSAKGNSTEEAKEGA